MVRCSPEDGSACDRISFACLSVLSNGGSEWSERYYPNGWQQRWSGPNPDDCDFFYTCARHVVFRWSLIEQLNDDGFFWPGVFERLMSNVRITMGNPQCQNCESFNVKIDTTDDPTILDCICRNCGEEYQIASGIGIFSEDKSKG